MFEPFKLGLVNVEHPISSHKAYFVDQSSDGRDQCQVDRCFKKYVFSWRNKDSCQLTFYCTKLWRNPCSEFGVSLNLMGETSKKHDICWTDTPFEAPVQTNSYVEVLFWYLPLHEYHIRCNFWCTFTGQIPQKPTKGPPDLLHQLVCAPKA